MEYNGPGWQKDVEPPSKDSRPKGGPKPITDQPMPVHPNLLRDMCSHGNFSDECPWSHEPFQVVEVKSHLAPRWWHFKRRYRMWKQMRFYKKALRNVGPEGRKRIDDLEDKLIYGEPPKKNAIFIDDETWWPGKDGT